MRNTIRNAAGVAALLMLAMPGVAGAHVTVQPSEAPAKGFTYTQNLPEHTAGASALRGQVRIAGTGPLGHIDRGDILQVTLTDSNWRARLAGLCGQLQARHLHAVPADQLIRGGS